MPLSELSESTQNYLKIIWSISEWSNDRATTSVIAHRTGNRLSSVSDALKRLAAADLVTYQPYQPVELTEQGRTYAVQMIRRHRLIETFLVEMLGYTWDQVHDEAENLEHAVSDFMIDRIDAVLSYPNRDPHGDPIPSSDGTVRTPTTQTLASLTPEENSQIKVERISDDDPALLRRCSVLGLVPGVVLTYRNHQYLLEKTALDLTDDEARAVFVRVIES